MQTSLIYYTRIPGCKMDTWPVDAKAFSHHAPKPGKGPGNEDAQNTQPSASTWQPSNELHQPRRTSPASQEDPSAAAGRGVED